MMDVTMGEVTTRYHGRNEHCAVVVVEGDAYPLTMGDTARAARDIGAATEIMRTIEDRIDRPGVRLERQAPLLQAHCRKITKFQPEIKRDRPRPRPQRGWL